MLKNDLGSEGGEGERGEGEGSGVGGVKCEGEVVCNTKRNCDKSPGENQPLPQ